MRILTRYMLKEMLTPTLLGFGFYTFIILMKNLFDFAEMIIKRSLPLVTVLKLLGLSLPHIVVLTIPMSLLVGILIAVGRLSADSEIIAMRSAGISTSSVYRPVFYFSLAVFLLNLYLMNFVLPSGNAALQRFRSELFTSAIEKEVQPRVFYDEFANWVIYVNDVDSIRGTWKGVFLSDAGDPQSQRVIVADTGRLSVVGPTKQVWAELQGARTHVFSPRRPDRYDLNSNRSQKFLLLDRYGMEGDKNQKSFREMGLSELFREADKARHVSKSDYRQIVVEIHKKFSIPFACIAFGILGLPLGITNRRGGKSSGFSLSLAIILLYYVLITNGETMARNGKMSPAVAMWLPNILLTALGFYLLQRANRETGAGSGTGFFGRLQSRVQRAKAERMAGAAVEDRVPILARLDIPFPNILDRYVLREFVKILLLVLISTALLFVIVDYMTSVGPEAAENKVEFAIVASYYRHFILQVINLVLPISVLLATLITFGMLSRNNEVTALKANGVSLYRMTLPVVVIAGLVSVLSYLLLDFVLPYSNSRVEELRARIRGKQTARAFTVQQRQWVFGKGRYLFNFLSYEPKNRVLSQVQVFEFAPHQFRLTRRVYAEEARFDGIGWVFVNGWIRSFGDDGSTSFAPIVNPVRLQYPERPDYFATEIKRPDQMTYRQLRRYIVNMRSSGYGATDLLVKLYEKTSWPFISLVMALIALPFSFRMGKKGALYGVGLALFLAFVYWTLFGVFTKFGEVGNLPAILSAWAANIVFGLAAVYMFLRVET